MMYHKILTSIVLPVSSSLLLFACANSSQTANHENFKLAIQTYFNTHPECIGAGSLPDDIGVIHSFSLEGLEPALNYNGQRYSALKQAGLIKAIEFDSQTELDGKAVYKRKGGYALTSKGREAFAKSKRVEPGMLHSGRAPYTLFCYATREVLSIDDFSEPIFGFDGPLTRVQYTARLKDISDWAKHPAIIEERAGYGERINGASFQETESLTLTDEGWVARY